MFLLNLTKGLWFDKDGGGTGGGGDDQNVTVEIPDWLKGEAIPDKIRELYLEDVKGLKTTVAALRDDLKNTQGIKKVLRDAELDPEKLPDVLKELSALKEAEDKRKKEELSVQEKAALELQEKQSALDKVQADHDKLLTALQTERKKNAVISAAATLGFADPADAYSLADLSKVAYDEEKGTFSGIEDALKSLSETKPYLLGENGAKPKGTPQTKGEKTINKNKEAQKVITPKIAY